MIICFPHPPGAGGPGSFQIRFEKALQADGWEIIYANSPKRPDVIMVVGGTRKLYWLWTMKQKGIPIVFRLDGINWLHRKRKTSLKSFVLAESRNFNNKFIHAFLADKIVYQSRFVENWWNKKGWKKRNEVTIVHNGVRLPDLPEEKKHPATSQRLVVLEGTIDYSPYAVRLLNELATRLSENISIELYGRFELPANQAKLHERIQYKGFVARDKVSAVMNGAIYLSLDINPACPNTVVEAMACGTPVVGFDTGALKELVLDDAGVIVPYGSDPWKLAYPDVDSLLTAIYQVADNYELYAQNARMIAEQKFTIDLMTEQYLEVLNNQFTAANIM